MRAAVIIVSNSTSASPFIFIYFLLLNAFFSDVGDLLLTLHAANQAALQSIQHAETSIRLRDLALDNTLAVLRPLYESEGEGALRGLLLDDEGTDDAIEFLRALLPPTQDTAPSHPVAESSHMAARREAQTQGKGGGRT